MSALAAVDRPRDGTPLYAPRGELRIDVDEQRVQCHLCGGWYTEIMQLTGASYTAVNRRISEGRAVLRGGRRNSHRTKRARQASRNGR